MIFTHKFSPKCTPKPDPPVSDSPWKKAALWSGLAFGALSPCRFTLSSFTFASKLLAVRACPPARLHDAAEVARAGIPTVMMFVQSLGGISHNKIEDTREAHLVLAIEAYARLAVSTAEWILK